MESIYTKCRVCGREMLQLTFDRNEGRCKPCGVEAETRRYQRELKARQRQLTPICEEDWLRMAPNGTFAEEARAVRFCLGLLEADSQQVVRDTTDSGLQRRPRVAELERLAFYLQSHLLAAENETICDFASKNGKPCPVSPDLIPAGESTLISAAELTQIFRGGGGWERFRELYPQSTGIVTISRVGLNFAATQALVCGGRQVDSLMGRGTYWLLRKIDGEWQEAERASAWVS